MRRQTVLEKSVVAAIMRRLRDEPGVVVRKRHGTAMGVAGDPDLYGSYRGKHFEIEVKRPFDSKSQLTKLQAQRQDEWRINGNAIVGVARGPEDALVILGIVGPEQGGPGHEVAPRYPRGDRSFERKPEDLA